MRRGLSVISSSKVRGFCVAEAGVQFLSSTYIFEAICMLLVAPCGLAHAVCSLRTLVDCQHSKNPQSCVVVVHETYADVAWNP